MSGRMAVSSAQRQDQRFDEFQERQMERGAGHRGAQQMGGVRSGAGGVPTLATVIEGEAQPKVTIVLVASGETL